MKEFLSEIKQHRPKCPSDIIDQIGGWATKGVEQGYGEGYSVQVLNKWLTRINSLPS